MNLIFEKPIVDMDFILWDVFELLLCLISDKFHYNNLCSKRTASFCSMKYL